MTTWRIKPGLKYARNAAVPPATLPWSKGDLVFDDQTGEMYVCKVGGTPGTWVTVGGATWDPGSGPVDTGSVIFGKSDGTLTEDNAHFFYDDATNTLKLRNTAASSDVLVAKVDGDAQERVRIRADGRVSWGDGSVGVDTFLERASALTLRANSLLQSSRAVTTDAAFATIVSGDTLSRFVVFADGKIEWGTGGGARDCILLRSAANLLATTDTGIQFIRTTATNSAVSVKASANAVSRLNIRADGEMQWSDGTNAADTVLFRGAANTLTTSNTLLQLVRTSAASSALQAFQTGDAFARFVVLANGTHEWGDGTNARDVTLARAAADILRFGAGDSLSWLHAAGTDRILHAGVSGDTNDRFNVNAAGQLEWGPGNAARDAGLHRFGNGALRAIDLAGGRADIIGRRVFLNVDTADSSERIRIIPPSNQTGTGVHRKFGISIDATTGDITTSAQTGDVSVVHVNQFTLTSTPAGTVIPDLAGIRVKGPVTSGANATATRTSAVLVETGADTNAGLAVRRNTSSQSGALFEAQNESGTRIAQISASGQFRGPDGGAGSAAVSFNADADNGLYRIGNDNWAASAGGAKILDLKNNGGTLQMGFFGGAPVDKPTGVGVDAASIHAALVSLGLIAA